MHHGQPRLPQLAGRRHLCCDLGAERRNAFVAIEKSNNPAAFLEFERAGWAANIAGYDDAFGPVSRQTVGPTLDAANLRSGMHLLDVCCGPGMLAQAAIERGARAVGLDFPEVVELARRLVPGGEFQPGDAQALPFADDT